MTIPIVNKGARRSLDPRDPSTPTLAGADTRIMEFVGRHGKISTAVASCKLERTIEGASSLVATIHDPHLAFLNSDAIKGAKPGDLHAEVIVDKQVFALCGITLLAGHQVEAVLEDDTVHRLRQPQFSKPLTMSRGKVTRAEFIKHMCDEAGVPLVCHELEKKQPIQTTTEAQEASERDRKRKPGFSGHAKLTVKGQPIGSQQRADLETALSEAASLGAGTLATLALIVAGIGESDFDRESVAHSQNGAQVGIWQSDEIPADHVAEQAKYFLTGGRSFQAGGAIHLARTQPHLTPGDIATMVEDSGEPGEFYNVYHAEAEVILNAFTGGNAGALAGSPTTYAKSYQFRRGEEGKLEDSWTCMRRLAQEVNWYLFVVSGTVYYLSGEQLESSRPRMLVAPGADGVNQPTGSMMTSPKFDDTLDVGCLADVWQAPPGSVSEVEGYGPFDGRLVVVTIGRENMKSAKTTATLGRIAKPKKEPAHELGTREETVPATPGIPGGGGLGSTGTPTAGEGNSGSGPAYDGSGVHATGAVSKNLYAWRNPGAGLTSAAPGTSLADGNIVWICEWMVPQLQYARQHGWGGVVSEGWRSYATEESYIHDGSHIPGETVASSATASNHSKSLYPGGAIDTPEYVELARALEGWPGTPPGYPRLRGAGSVLPADPVHFSVEGN